jgi:4-amino-4-deoxy-L-arabinose transferase-like glycosyltransferase
MRKGSILIALILLVGTGLRAYFLISGTQTNSDGVLYSWIAGNLADGYGYTIAQGTSLNDARQWHVPAFPLVLALFYSILGKGLLISRLPAFVFGISSIILLYILCEKLFDKPTGLIASLFLALHPNFIFFSAEVMTESMYIFLLLLFLIFLTHQRNPNDFKPVILTGILAGLCYLTRTAGILTIPVFALYAINKHRSEFTKAGASFIGGFLLPALPWWLWSKTNYGTPFSAEQNTIIQMFELEFGVFNEESLGFFSYLGLHDLKSIFLGYLDGTLRLLTSSFYPKVSYLTGGEKLGMMGTLALLIVVIVLLYGVWNQVKNGKPEINLALFGTLAFGALGYAWAVHIISPQSSTIFRYTLPISLVLIIYLARGVKKLLEGSVKSRLIAIASIIIIVSSSLVLAQSNKSTNRSMVDDFYSLAASHIPRGESVLASNPRLVENQGFAEVHPIVKLDFNGILKEADEKGIRYVIIDTSSIYNEDQYYLVNYWYRDRIPDRFRKKSNDLFPVSVYEIIKASPG